MFVFKFVFVIVFSCSCSFSCLCSFCFMFVRVYSCLSFVLVRACSCSTMYVRARSCSSLYSRVLVHLHVRHCTFVIRVCVRIVRKSNDSCNNNNNNERGWARPRKQTDDWCCESSPLIPTRDHQSIFPYCTFHDGWFIERKGVPLITAVTTLLSYSTFQWDGPRWQHSYLSNVKQSALH